MFYVCMTNLCDINDIYPTEKLKFHHRGRRVKAEFKATYITEYSKLYSHVENKISFVKVHTV